MIKAPAPNQCHHDPSASIMLEKVELEQTVTLLEQYIQQLSLENFSSSASKRIGTTLLIKALDPILQGRPLLLPLKWAGTSLAGWISKKLGRNLVHQRHPSEALTAQSDTMMAMSVLEDFAVVQKQEKATTLPKRMKALVVTLSDTAQSYLTDTTAEDIASGAFATLGSAGVGVTFVFFSGPLGWLGIPALWLSEGAAKSFAAFLGKQWSHHCLGDKATLPLYYQLLHQQTQIKHQEDEEMSVLLEEFEFLSITDDPLPKAVPEQSSRFLIDKPAILIEDYVSQTYFRI